MSAKTFTLNGLGDVTVYKRRGTRHLNLRVIGDKIKVTQPVWLPYHSGTQFAQHNQQWILSQRAKQPNQLLKNRLNVGKNHKLLFEPGPKLRTRLINNQVVIYVPPLINSDSPSAQAAAKMAIKKALRQEAEQLLPARLSAIASKYGYSYNAIKFKNMRSRWGSCNNSRTITLSTYLMMIPWDLIDYVLLHELTHTKYLHHGQLFWQLMADTMPDYKERRKALKNLQHEIASLQ